MVTPYNNFDEYFLNLNKFLINFFNLTILNKYLNFKFPSF
jgi:hypothetical protein